jgi:flagellar basal-body rod modification protein FlgD
MTISLTQASAANSPTTATPSNQLKGTSDEFLKLFMAQLQNQNPLDPQSGADMVSQLATFSQVEQATQTNSNLASLLAAQTSSASSGMASLVGRNCSATTGSFTLDGTGAPPPIDVSSTSSMKGSTLQVTDSTGKVVRTMTLPDSTSSTIKWDGKDDSGHTLPPGSYTMSVGGTSAATVDAQWSGKVDSVELTPDGTRLRMGDVLINPSDIRTIGAISSTQQGTT